MTKTYPFSVQKHAHDIDFARNRAKNILHDMEMGEIPHTEEEYDKLCDKIERLTELVLAIMDSRDGKIAYLTGPQIGLAKEMMLWADCERHGRMKQRAE